MEASPGPRRPVSAVCIILCSNVRGLAGNLRDLTRASSLFDILLCYEILDSDMRDVSELLVPGVYLPLLLCRTRGMAPYVRDLYGAYRQPSLSVVV